MHVGLVTLGCDKNTVDTEYLAGLLEQAGSALGRASVDDGIAWDAVVVITCGFIGDAQLESAQTLVDWAERKRQTGFPRRLFAAGCLAQRYPDALRAEVPELDGIAGVGQFESLAQMVLDTPETPASALRVNPAPCMRVDQPLPRKRLETTPYAFLKIADGCNHRCGFCAIPGMKGPYHSVPREILLDEARQLLAQGVKEINLIAQDISVYATDLNVPYRLPDLVRDLCALEGDFWVRCLYCYPGGSIRELAAVMAHEPKVTPYLDVPLQHLDPGVLRAMRRPFHDADTRELIAYLRATVPGIVLRTTLLAGYPGESHWAHKRMLEGMRELAFPWLGAFEYSPEEGTPAAEAPRQVGPVTRNARWHAVMAQQSEITAAFNEARIGEHVRVLIEAYDEERKCWRGRTRAEAPEVDGCVFITAKQPLAIGQFTNAVITSADVYDVFAEATV